MDDEATPEDVRQVREAERTALAMLATLAGGDDWEEDAAVVVRDADPHTVLAAAILLLGDALREHGTDPAEWAARKQAESVAREAHGS
jgi:hypothetical protein